MRGRFRGASCIQLVHWDCMEKFLSRYLRPIVKKKQLDYRIMVGTSEVHLTAITSMSWKRTFFLSLDNTSII